MANWVHQYSGKAAPEKSNFAQTCNLLNQYLKGRGNVADINFKLEAKGSEASKVAATTLNLLPKMENSAENLKQYNTLESANSMNFFPQFVGSASPNPVEDSTDKTAVLRKSSRSDPATAQMTIFYAGKVIVFDNFPADKAKAIMALASKGSSDITSSAMDITHSTNPIVPASKNPRQGLNLQPGANGSDLPIARRDSLYRFFEKRKDRVAAKAPYQINIRSAAAPAPKYEERNPWLDLEGQSSKQLELKL